DHHGGDVPAHSALLSPVAALGFGAAGDRRLLCRLHAGIGAAVPRGQGRYVERPRASPYRRRGMSDVAALQSGKDHTKENFPVASVLIAPQHRPPVMAFYKFVRAA